MYMTRVRPDGYTAPPTKWADGSVSYPTWVVNADIEVLMQFDYDAIDGFNTFVKADSQYFMMMSIDLE